MAKKTLRKSHKTRVARSHSYKPSGEFVTVVKAWTFIVALALMLGLGTIVGNSLNSYYYNDNPQVAGASTEF